MCKHTFFIYIAFRKVGSILILACVMPSYKSEVRRCDFYASLNWMTFHRTGNSTDVLLHINAFGVSQ